MTKDTRRTERFAAGLLIAIFAFACGVVAMWARPDLFAFSRPVQTTTVQSTTPPPAIALPPVTPTTAPTTAPPAPTEAVEEPDAVMPVFSGSHRPWLTPVECQEAFNEASAWLICEPGKPTIPPESLVFDILDVDRVYHVNVPEGGFTYLSLGEGVIAIDGVTLSLPGEEGLNYLVLLRGRIDDTIMDSDLNETARVTDFVAGHAIYTILAPGAYVSHDWFRQQLVMSSTTGGTNCGATGCSRVRIVLFDVDSHFTQRFETHAGDIDSWTLLSEN